MLSLFAFLLAAIYPDLFPDEASMQGILATINNPSMIAMMGPVYGLEAITPAIVMAQNCLVWFAIAVIVMNIFFINRYTRTDEELGRMEMIISLPVGRLTGSVSMVFLSFVLNIAVALLIAAFTLIVNIEGNGAVGALAYGLSIGMQGFLFAMLTLLMAQLFSTARGSMGAAFALLGISYICRAYGDMNNNLLSYISPMGLGLKVEAFYSNHLMPVIALFAQAVVAAAVALWVNARRDTGAGVFPARKGKAYASKFLQTPVGFAWRLSRGGFFAWGIGIFALSASYGSVVGELDNFVESNEGIKQILEGSGGASSLVDAYIAMLSCMISLLVSIPLINCINRLRTEEKRGRLESVVATSVSRKSLFGSFILVAALEAVVLTLLGAFGLYAAASSSELINFGTLIKALFAYLPVLLVMIALSAFFVGLLPKLKSLVWLLFGYSFLMFYFGRLFKVPEIAVKLSPFGNIPQLPIQEFSAQPLVILCIIATGLCLIGIMGFGKRDVKN
jgi:ABC-2 type transport system permease protein